MLCALAQRAAGGDAPAALLRHARGYLAPIAVEISDGFTGTTKARAAPNLTAEWSKAKTATQEAILKLHAYKQVGDSKEEPLLHFHNPRTFEDFDKPVPNFKKFGLKAGEVPKFFDQVLGKRASESVAVKGSWWDQRSKEAAEVAASLDKVLTNKQQAVTGFRACAAATQPVPKVPVPKWELGKPVPLSELQGVTDKLVQSLEPARKLKVPSLPASVKELSAYKSIEATLTAALADTAVVEQGGKPLKDFAFVSGAKLEARLAARRAEVHARWVKMWAKRVLAQPEQALVPLRERDGLLASKFEDVGSKFNGLVELAARGPETFGKRLASVSEMDGFFLRRSHAEVEEMFPPSEEEKEAAALAKQLQDPSYALDKLLGPALHVEGPVAGQLRSEHARALADHLYTPDRYFHAEGLKLAERYAAEEASLADKLRALYGREPTTDDILAAQEAKGPIAAQAEREREAAARVAALEAAKADYADNEYMQYALSRQAEFYKDASNVPAEEVLYPELIAERFAIEMAELDEKEAMIDEAEEEELWILTLAQQSRHIAQHIEFDLPQAVYAHMDPILYKKLDWEVTQGYDLMHHEAFQAADCEQGEYVKEQMGLENLSHHFLPLIRYRRAKARALYGSFTAEKTALPVKSTPVA